MDAAGLAADLLALIGVALLAVPAFHAAKYAGLAADLEKQRNRLGALSSPEGGKHVVPGRAAFEKAHRNLVAHRDSWTPWKGKCLKGGTWITILAAMVAVAASALKLYSG